MSAAVLTHSLRKEFKLGWGRGRVLAVEGLDLEVKRGEVFGLLGPNGSGKSTAMKMILGLLRPTSGRAEVCGCQAGTLAARKQIGFLPENPYFPAFLSGAELVRYYGKLSGMGGKALEGRVQELLSLVRLGDEAGRRLYGRIPKACYRGPVWREPWSVIRRLSCWMNPPREWIRRAPGKSGI